MNQKTVLLLIACMSLTFTNCDNNDSPLDSALNAKYPAAKKVSWETKGAYHVADFIQNNLETSAWFDAKGTWCMTETDIPLTSLPKAVLDTHNAGKYAAWTIEDIDMLERKETETVYIIEVESKEQEIDLYYSTEGILIKAVADTDNTDYESHLPQPTDTQIERFINEKYPQARIIEIEKEAAGIEVDIIHDNKGKEVVFDLNSQWQYTTWEVHLTQLPEAVSNIVNNALYTGYHIDDADFVETAQSSFYLLELEKGNSELKIKVDQTGTVLAS